MATQENDIELKQQLDSLLLTYKSATDEWVAAIRKEEAFAQPDHSMTEWEEWDLAAEAAEDAGKKAKEARAAYSDALRKKLYNF